jgi:hypothetical protein
MLLRGLLMSNLRQKCSQERILSYLYQFNSSPDWTLDLEVHNISSRLNVGVEEILEQLNNLQKKQFVLVQNIHGYSYCKILVKGIREINKQTTSTIRAMLTTREIGVEGEKQTVH